nr:endolytic transglycosylase MltG [Paludibacterium paludis]
MFGRLVLATVVAAFAWLAFVVLMPVSPPEPSWVITVGPNRTLSQVATSLADKGLVRNRNVMVALARLAGTDRKLKAGIYRFHDGASMLDILRRFAEGRPDEASVTMLEGWNFRQIREALARNADLTHATKGWSEAQVMTAIGASSAEAEGWLFPSTYFFTPGSTDLDIFKRAYQAMDERLAAVWRERDPGLPYASPVDLLKVASLVEKETSLDADRPMVAAVFVNRLRIGMRLQTDPSVIYGMGSAFNGNLTKRDLQRDTPYNTYTRSGLPPTPISMPGKAALAAAAHPAKSRALYFVARGDGSSYFSETLDEHNSAVRRYIFKKGQ